MSNEDSQRAPAILRSSDVPEIQRIKVQFLALAQKAMDEGEHRHNVVYALGDAILDLLADEHLKGDEEFRWARQFLHDAELGFGDWRRFMDLINEMADQVERSRAAGGTGKVFQ